MMRANFIDAVHQRWVVMDEYGRTIPTPLIIMLILWLAIIFASFGYRAPRNTIVTASFFLAGVALLGGALSIVDKEMPTTGMIEVSNVPVQRALAQLQR